MPTGLIVLAVLVAVVSVVGIWRILKGRNIEKPKRHEDNVWPEKPKRGQVLCFSEVPTSKCFLYDDRLHYKLNDKFVVACKIKDDCVIGDGIAFWLEPEVLVMAVE